MEEYIQKTKSRRTKPPTVVASTQFHGVEGDANLHEGGDGQMLQQIRVDGGAEHLEVLRYLSTARTSFHIPESGMIPQLRFNPGTKKKILTKILASIIHLFCITLPQQQHTPTSGNYTVMIDWCIIG